MAMDKKKDKNPLKEVTKLEDAAARKKALAAAIAQIEKQYGEGTIMLMGAKRDMNIEHISTGSLMLDLALGIGGLPKGRIIEVFGAESSGKTTLCLHAVAEAQKAGGTAAFIDVEHALDPVYAKKLGVDVDNLLVSQPDTGEQALEIVETLVRSGAVDIVVLDSVAAMATRAEIDGEMGDAHVGVQARLMSQAMRKLTAIISKTNCIAVFINQVREKIGVLYGNPETTPGGRALKFYASVRIDVRKGEPIKTGTEVHGHHTKCKVVKNKVAPPYKTAEFDMIFGEGISKMGEIIDCAVLFNIIKKSGSWFSYDGMKIGQGKDKVKDFLKNNAEVCAEIEAKVREEFSKNSEAMDLLNDKEDDDDIPGTPPKKKGEAAAETTADDDFSEFATDDIEKCLDGDNGYFGIQGRDMVCGA